MIEIKEALIDSLLHEAIQQADTHNGVQLVSITKQIDALDPLAFFEMAKQTKKDRVFWSSVVEDFYIVGIGKVHEIIANTSRFESTEKQWQELIERAIIHNPYNVPGTGILSLGGMSFDPLEKRSELWKKYAESQFVIPEYVVTKDKDTYYFTIITKVESGDEVSEIAPMLKDMEKKLFQKKAVFLPENSTITAKEEIELEKWLQSVKQAINEIKDERAKKIVLAREMRVKLNKQAEISVMLQRLIEMQPTSYVFAFEQGDDCFIGATPERLVQLKGNELLSTCLAGTAPRGRTTEEDQAISEAFLQDDKNLEEHAYVVQMIRSSMEDYCTDVSIPSEPTLYRLKNLQHLYTPVTATLKEGYSIFNIIKQLHPTPALGGVPREESLAFIREHEPLDRGWYGAPIGWLDSEANGEFAVAIRSGLIQGDEASLFAGCGIMRDSDPNLEYEETNIKFLPMLSVMEDQDEQD